MYTTEANEQVVERSGRATLEHSSSVYSSSDCLLYRQNFGRVWLVSILFAVLKQKKKRNKLGEI